MIPFRTAGLACLLFMLFLSPAIAAEPDFLAPPPVDYQRVVQIKVTDPFGRPLKGVQADIKVLTGRLAISPVPTSDKKGLIIFAVQPVVEDINQGKAIHDRFLIYHTKLTYRLSLKGRIPVSGEIKDHQEFATFINPLYHGLDRTPDTSPLILDRILADYRDYLVEPKDDPAIKAFVEDLVAEGRKLRFTPRPRSITMDRQGRLFAHLDFGPLFDPAKYGLTEAGRELVKGPARSVVEAAERHIGPAKEYEIRMTVQFQSPQHPFALPVEQTYVFRLSPDAARTLTGGGIPKKGLAAAVENTPIDLLAKAPQMQQ